MTLRKELKERFKKYEVKSNSLEEFCNTYYKKNRYSDRGVDYVLSCLESHVEHLDKYGYTFITSHDSVTGEIVSYYPY